MLADVHARDEESARARGRRRRGGVRDRRRRPRRRTGSSSTSSPRRAPRRARAARGRDDPRAARAAARGRVLARVEILDPRLTRPYDLFEVAEELEGDRVLAVERRGKYLLLRLESGLGLLVHLRMTGSFGFSPVLARACNRRARRRHAARLSRRAPLRDVARARGGGRRAVPRDEERARAARPGLHRALARLPARATARCRSRPFFSTSASSPASGTSTPTRRSGARA